MCALSGKGHDDKRPLWLCSLLARGKPPDDQARQVFPSWDILAPRDGTVQEGDFLFEKDFRFKR